MSRAVAGLALVTLMGVHPGLTAAPQGTTHVRVLTGSATLLRAGDERYETLTRKSGLVRVEGGAQLEQGSRGEVSLRWRGRASASLQGRASYELGHEDGGARRPLIALRYLGRAQLEARRDGLVVELPGGWRAELERAVLVVRELSKGELELFHPGGRRIVLTSRGEQRLLLSGERVRIAIGGGG